MSETTPKKVKQTRTTPNPIGELTILSGKVAKGLEAGGTAAGIRFATAEELRTKTAELIASETIYQAVLASKTTTLIPALKGADATGRKFIMDSKKVLSIPLGNKWTQAWAEVGFLNDNLKCPSTIVERLSAINKLALYFTGHPACESPSQSITAEQAAKVAKALSDAHDALDSYDTNRKENRTARNNANSALRKAVNGVIVEARRRLAIDSPLWDTFGLSAPKPRAPRPRKEKPAKAPKAAKKSKASSQTTRPEATADRTAAPSADAKVQLSS